VSPRPGRRRPRARCDRRAADYDAATSIIATLAHQQLVSALWCVCRWYGSSFAQNFEDPVGVLHGLALVLARGHGEAA
jgi:hypothetical protein